MKESEPKKVYRTIHLKMWGDEKFRSLSPQRPSAQTLWIYLLTGPQTNRIGLYQAGEMSMAEALEWDLKDYRKAFQEVFQKGLVKWSSKDRLLYIPKFVLYNPPSSPNVVKGWKREWDLVPNCSLKSDAYDLLKASMEATGKAFVEAFIKTIEKPSIEAFGKPLGKGIRNQEQEQEQEQENIKTPPTSPKENSPTSKKYSAQQYAPEFESFWKEYPKKVAKGVAYKAWMKQKPPLDACLSSLEWQKKTDQWLKENGQYIPHPASWINAKRWEDEPIRKEHASRVIRLAY